MTDVADITIKTIAELHIYINTTSNALVNNANAAIITAEGELIEQIKLNEGLNIINISKYASKNCAIKVVNGKNVTVKKI